MDPSPADIVGKRLIVGLTFLDSSGGLIEQAQVHGRVARVSDAEGIVLTKADAGEFIIPPRTNVLRPARPGEYRLRASGEVVVSPDYLASFTMSDTQPENVARYKAEGFTGGFG